MKTVSVAHIYEVVAASHNHDVFNALQGFFKTLNITEVALPVCSFEKTPPPITSNEVVLAISTTGVLAVIHPGTRNPVTSLNTLLSARTPFAGTVMLSVCDNKIPVTPTRENNMHNQKSGYRHYQYQPYPQGPQQFMRNTTPEGIEVVSANGPTVVVTTSSLVMLQVKHINASSAMKHFAIWLSGLKSTITLPVMYNYSTYSDTDSTPTKYQMVLNGVGDNRLTIMSFNDTDTEYNLLDIFKQSLQDKSVTLYVGDNELKVRDMVDLANQETPLDYREIIEELDSYTSVNLGEVLKWARKDVGRSRVKDALEKLEMEGMRRSCFHYPTE